MKAFWIIFAIIAVLAIIYFLNKSRNKPISITNLTNNYNSGYELGLSLANLVANTKCGKEGRPPCTKTELQAEGWSPEQIAIAEQASGNASSFSLCYTLGIGC